jgi:hypothetical protein
MATNSQYLNGQLSDAQIEQLIQSLRGIKPVENENDILNAEKTVNKEKMASYAEILKDDGKNIIHTIIQARLDPFLPIDITLNPMA